MVQKTVNLKDIARAVPALPSGSYLPLVSFFSPHVKVPGTYKYHTADEKVMCIKRTP